MKRLHIFAHNFISKLSLIYDALKLLKVTKRTRGKQKGGKRAVGCCGYARIATVCQFYEPSTWTLNSAKSYSYNCCVSYSYFRVIQSPIYV